RRFAAIVDDAREMGSKADPLWPPSMLEDLPAVREALFENYFIAERLEEGCLPIRKHAPAHPRPVYLPRHARLEALSPGPLRRRPEGSGRASAGRPSWARPSRGRWRRASRAGRPRGWAPTRPDKPSVRPSSECLTGQKAQGYNHL